MEPVSSFYISSLLYVCKDEGRNVNFDPLSKSHLTLTLCFFQVATNTAVNDKIVRAGKQFFLI